MVLWGKSTLDIMLIWMAKGRSKKQKSCQWIQSGPEILFVLFVRSFFCWWLQWRRWWVTVVVVWGNNRKPHLARKKNLKNYMYLFVMKIDGMFSSTLRHPLVEKITVRNVNRAYWWPNDGDHDDLRIITFG